MNAEVLWGAGDTVSVGRALRAIEDLNGYSSQEEVGASLFRLVSAFNGVRIASDSHKLAVLYALMYGDEVSTMIAKSPDSWGHVDVLAYPTRCPADVQVRRVTGRGADARWAGVTLQFNFDGSLHGGEFTYGMVSVSPAYGFLFDGTGRVMDIPAHINRVNPGGTRVNITGLLDAVTNPAGLDFDFPVEAVIAQAAGDLL